MNTWQATRAPRPNLRAVEEFEEPLREMPVRYGIDWTKFIAWSGAMGIGIGFWVGVYFMVLWVMG